MTCISSATVCPVNSPAIGVTDDSQDLLNAPPPSQPAPGIDAAPTLAAESGPVPGDAPRQDDVDPAAPAATSPERIPKEPPKKPPRSLLVLNPIKDIFTLGKRLGSGRNGITYRCTSVSIGLNFAAKVETEDGSHSLKDEAEIYLALGSEAHGIAKFKGSGIIYYPNDYRQVIVLERLRRPLWEKLEACGGTLGLRTVLVIGLDMISAFGSLHKKDYVYGFLKLDSFLVTNSRDGVRRVDFGRTHTREEGLETRSPIRYSYLSFWLSEGRVCSVAYQNGRRASLDLSFPNSSRLAARISLTSPRSAELAIGPKDDLQSFDFLLLYPLQGCENLPWSIEPTALLKNAAIDHSGMDDLPPYFQRVIKYCLVTAQNLSIEELPDYEMLKLEMMTALAEAREVQRPVMWEKDRSREVWRKLEKWRRVHEGTMDQPEVQTGGRGSRHSQDGQQ